MDFSLDKILETEVKQKKENIRIDIKSPSTSQLIGEDANSTTDNKISDIALTKAQKNIFHFPNESSNYDINYDQTQFESSVSPMQIRTVKPQLIRTTSLNYGDKQFNSFSDSPDDSYFRLKTTMTGGISKDEHKKREIAQENNFKNIINIIEAQEIEEEEENEGGKNHPETPYFSKRTKLIMNHAQHQEEPQILSNKQRQKSEPQYHEISGQEEVYSKSASLPYKSLSQERKKAYFGSMQNKLGNVLSVNLDNDKRQGSLLQSYISNPSPYNRTTGKTLNINITSASMIHEGNQDDYSHNQSFDENTINLQMQKMNIHEFMVHLNMQVTQNLDHVFSEGLNSILGFFKDVEKFIETVFGGQELEIKIDLMKILLRMSNASSFIETIFMIQEMRMDFLANWQTFELFMQVLMMELKWHQVKQCRMYDDK